MFPLAFLFIFTYGMFDRVVHDDVIFSYWQPGAERDDVTVPKGLWALPCKQTREVR